MGRRRKGPWLRKQDNCWYTTIGRKAHKLGSGDQPYTEIEAAYFALLAKGEQPATISVAWLCEQFLAHVERTRAPATHAWYAKFLTSFRAYFGPRLLPQNLCGAMVDRWIGDRYHGASGSTQNAAARSIVRVMNWAVSQQHIDRSPLQGYTKPQPSTREEYVTPAEYRLCLEHARQPFQDLLVYLWETGCRPQEVRVIEARWIDGRKVTLPRELSKGKKKRRVIYMNETAVEIALRLSGEWTSGPIFRNSNGKPWTKDSINCAFRRLKKKTNLDHLCAYALRHGFATQALKRGVDTTTVGVIMGHANPNMVAKVYQHLAQDDDYLLGVIDSAGTPPIAPG